MKEKMNLKNNCKKLNMIIVKKKKKNKYKKLAE